MQTVYLPHSEGNKVMWHATAATTACHDNDTVSNNYFNENNIEMTTNNNGNDNKGDDSINGNRNKTTNYNKESHEICNNQPGHDGDGKLQQGWQQGWQWHGGKGSMGMEVARGTEKHTDRSNSHMDTKQHYKKLMTLKMAGMQMTARTTTGQDGKDNNDN